MKKKTMKKFTLALAMPLTASLTILPLSGNTIVNSPNQPNGGMDQVNDFIYDGKYTTSLFWTSRYKIHTDIEDDWSKSFTNQNQSSDLDNFIQLHNASGDNFDPVNLTDSTKLSNGWDINSTSTTWWSDSDVQNPNISKKYLVRFNGDVAARKEGYLVGAIYLSKDMALTGKLNINLRNKNNLSEFYEQKSFTISETENTDGTQNIINRFRSINTSISTPINNPKIWSLVYHPVYSEAPSMKSNVRDDIEINNGYKFLNSQYGGDSRDTLESRKLAIDRFRNTNISNYLIHNRYENKKALWSSTWSKWRDGKEPWNWSKGLFNKYLDRQPYDTWYLNVDSLRNLRNASSGKPYNVLNKNGGALLLVYSNQLDPSKQYVMDIEFEVKPNIFDDGTVPIDFNSSGESFFGVSSMTPQNKNDVTGKDYDNRYFWSNGIIRHSDRTETTNIKFITREELSSGVDESEEIPSSASLQIYRAGNSSANNILEADRNYLTVNRTYLQNSTNKKSFKTRNSLILEPSTIKPEKLYSYNNELNKWTNDWLFLKATLGTEEDQKKWKPTLANNGQFQASNELRYRDYVDQTLTWDYTDYEKLRRHIESKQWLTKGQKDYYKNLILNRADKNNYYSISNYDNLKAEIDKHDKAQKDVEQAYNKIVNYVTDNKSKFIFASDDKKQQVINVLNTYWEVGSFKSSFNNNNDGFLKRNEYTTFKPLTFLTSSLNAINNYINTIKILEKLDGDSRINAYKTSIEQYDVIKESPYNKQRFTKFLNEIKNTAETELGKLTPTVFGANGAASLDAVKAQWTNKWINDTNYWAQLNDLKNSIDTAELIYDKSKVINGQLKRLKDNLTDANIDANQPKKYYLYDYLQKFKNLNGNDISSLWKGYSFRESFNQHESAWNELFKELIGTSTTDSNNIFSDATNKYKKDDNTKYVPENLKNISTIKTNYETKLASLVESLNKSFGNGAKLVEEFEKYSYLTKKELRKYWIGTSNQRTDYFGDLNAFYENSQSHNLNNFVVSPSDSLVMQESNDQEKVNKFLKNISDRVYSKAAEAVKTTIQALQYLPTDLKDNYKNQISSLVTTKANVLYKNDTDFTSILNEAKLKDAEQKRINDIATTLTQANKFDYAGKDQVLVNNAQLSGFSAVDKSQYQNVNIIIKKIAETDPIITGGKAKVSYIVQSKTYNDLYSYSNASSVPANNSESTESSWSTSDWITGFKPDAEREKARLNALNLQFNNLHNKTHLASEINTSNFATEIQVVNNVQNVQFNPTTEELVSLLFEPNDRDGSLVVNYVIKSKQLPEVKIAQRGATVNTTTNKFKTEQDRLNAIFASFKATLKTAINNKAKRLPSHVAESEVTQFNDLANGSNAKVVFVTKTANDNDGTLTIEYKIQSTRSTLEDIQSSTSKNLTETGFLTLLEQKRAQVIKYISDSKILADSEKTTLKGEANTANSISALEAIEEKAKIWELSNGVQTQYTSLNNNQVKEVVKNIRAKSTLAEANVVFNDVQQLNQAMSNLHDKVIEQLKALIPNNSLSNDQDKTAKTAINYKLSDSDKQTAYDQALKAAQDLLNKTSGENKNQTEVNTILSNLESTYAALNGTVNKNDLHSKIDQLTHLSTTQKQDLKNLVDASSSKEDAQKIYEKGKLFNDNIGQFKGKIREADLAKTTEAYTEDTTTNQGTFDTALGNANSELTALQNQSLSNLNATQIENKAGEVATKTTTLNNAINALDGYRNKVKKSLNNWEYLTAKQVELLQNKVNNASKIPTDDEVNAILNEGLNLAKTTAKTKITQDIYPNLNPSEINSYKGLVDSGTVIKTTGEKYDKKLKDYVDQAAQDNTTKQNAINAINGLDTLTAGQKAIFVNSIKNQVAASAAQNQTAATELNGAIKDLKKVVLEKQKDLADDQTLTYENMFNASKNDKKYRLADTDKQTAYDAKLTEIKTAIEKDNVQKSEIEKLKQPFLDAFDALNGEENERALHAKIESLTNLNTDQRNNLKKLVSDANSLADARAIVTNATTLNDAIATLEAKITKAKEVKVQPIYQGEDNKKPFDDALSEAETTLSALKSNNLESSSASDLQSKASGLNAKESELQTAIDNLDGVRKQFKKDLAAKWNLLEEGEKNTLISKVDTIAKDEFNDTKKEEIVKEGFGTAKSKAKSRLSTTPFPNTEFPNLNANELNAIATKIDSETDTPFNINADKYDDSVVKTLNEATTINKQKQQAIDKINDKTDQTEYHHLTDNQRAEFVKLIKSEPLAKTQELLTTAKQLDQAIAEAKGLALEKEKDLAQDTNLAFENIPSNAKSKPKYKFATNQNEYDSKLTDLLSEIQKSTPLATTSSINAAKTNFTDAYNALDGDVELNKLKTKVSRLDNLTPTQKTEINTLLDNSDNLEAAKQIATKAENVHNSIQSLKDKIADAEAEKAKTIYTSDTQTKREDFDDAIQEAKDAIEDYKAQTFDADGKLDSLNTTITDDISTLNDEIDKLDGDRQGLRDEINAYSDDLLTDKTTYLNEINGLNRVSPDATRAKIILDSAFDAAKTVTENKVNGLDLLTNEEKKTFTDEINKPETKSGRSSTNPDTKLKEEIQKAEVARKLKQDAIQAIEGMSDLTRAQKDKFIEKIKLSNSSEAANIQANAQTLNDKIIVVKAKIVKEVQTLTNSSSLDYDQAKTKTNSDFILSKYKFEDAATKSDYDTKLATLKALLENKEVDTLATQIEEAQTNLKQAYDDLNGDEELKKLKEKIDALNNLSNSVPNNQIEQLKNNINTANTLEDAAKIVTAAETLNTEIGALNQEIKKANNLKASDELYTKDTESNKETYDNAIKAAQDKLDALKAKDLTTSTKENIKSFENEASNAKTELENAKEILNGYKEDLKNDLSNWELLSEEQIKELKQAIEDLTDKKPTDEQRTNLLNGYFAKAQEAGKAKLIDTEYPNLSTDELDQLKGEVTKAQVNATKDATHDDSVKAILDKAAQWNTTKANAIAEVNKLTNLTVDQKAKFIEKIQTNSTSEAVNIQNSATGLDGKIATAKAEIVSEIKTLSNTNSLTYDQSKDKANTDFTAGKYRFEEASKKAAYDSKLTALKDLIANSNVDAITSQIDQAKSNLQDAFNALNGDAELNKLKEELGKLTNLNPTQIKNLKINADKADTLEKAKEIVEAAKKLNTEIGNLKDAIDAANTFKATDDLYTKDTETSKQAYDDAITVAENKLNELKGKDLTSSSKEDLEGIAREATNATSTLKGAQNNLNGYKEDLKNDLSNWDVLPNNEIEELKKEIDKLQNKKPTNDERKTLLDKYFGKTQTEGKSKLTQNQYPNLTKNELNELKENVDSAAVNVNKYEKHDNSVKDILDKAQEWNDAKNTAITEINDLDNLTDDQKQTLVNEVKSSSHDQATAIKDKAVALDASVKALKDEALRELKELSKNDNLTPENMFDAGKTANKYKSAESELKTKYDEALDKAKELLSKANVTKDEIESAKTALEAAFNALNGGDQINDLKSQVNGLNNLTPEQKNQIKDLIENADNLETAKDILKKSNDLNVNLGKLKDKIIDAESKINDPIYSNDTTDKKSAFNKAIESAKKDLENYSKVDFTNATAETISSTTDDVNTSVETLDSAINALDGNRQALRDEINAYQDDLLVDKNTYLEKINKLNQKDFQASEGEAILNEAFDAAKEKAKEKIDALSNLTKSETDAYKQQMTSAVKGASNAPDSNLSSIITNASNDNTTKEDAIDRIKALPNLTIGQKEEFERQIKAQPVANVTDIEAKANALNTEIPVAKQYATDMANKKNDLKYKWADNQEQFDNKLQALNDLINSNTATKEQIEAAKTDLENAYNTLNGENRLDELKTKIGELNHLSDSQKGKLKETLGTIDNYENGEIFVESAKSLDNKVGALKAKIQDAKDKKVDPIYSKDTTEKQQAFDTAITNAETALGNYLAEDLSNLDATQLDAKETPIDQSISALNDEIDKLDGKRQALRDEINAYSNDLISEADKKSYIDRINALNQKDPATEDANKILSDAFEAAQNKAKTIINDLPNLNQDEKDSFIQSLDQAQKGNSTSPDSNLNQIITKAKEDNKTKQDAIDAIKKLTHLNEVQIQHFEKEVKSESTSEASKIQTKAETLDFKIQDTKETYLPAKEVNKEELKYKWADNQGAFDTKIQELTDLIETSDVTIEAIETAKTTLEEAYNALNGETKLNALKERIGALNKLEEAQRESLKTTLPTLDSYEAAEEFVTKAEQLNNKISNLDAKIAEAEGKKADPIYSNDTSAKQQAFDSVIVQAKAAREALKQEALNSENATSLDAKTTKVNEEITKLDEAIAKLDGKREAIRTEINAYTDQLLPQDRKQEYLKEVEVLDRENPDQAKLEDILNRAFQEAQNKAKEIISGYKHTDNKSTTSSKYLNDEDIRLLDVKVNNATKDTNSDPLSPDKNLLTVLKEAQDSNNDKQTAITKIDGLPHLNDLQKADLKTEIIDTLSSGTTEVSNKADALNASMLTAKNTIVTELKELTNNTALTVETLNDDAYNKDKVADKYKFANEELRTDYDAKLDTLKTVLTQNSDKSTIDTKTKELKEAYEKLVKSSEENKKAYDDVLNELDKLDQDQKDKLKEVINNAANKEEADKIIEAAKKFNLSLDELEKQIAATKAKQALTIYANDAQDRKESVDEQLTNAETVLKNLKANPLDNLNEELLNSLAGQADTAKDSLKTATDALDGIREVARNNVKDHFPTLTEEQKAALVGKINNLPKETDDTAIDLIYNNGLEYAKTNAKEELKTLGLLTQDERNTYEAKIDEAAIDLSDADYAINVKKAIDAAKEAQKAKLDAISAVNKLEHLNKAQKDAYANQITNAEASEANSKLEASKTLNNKMGEYKNLSKVNEEDIDYKEASENKQQAYQNALTTRDKDFSDENGSNLSLDAVEKRIEAFNNAKDDLDGEERLAKAKADAIAKIEGTTPEYTHLTAEQKETAKEQINKQTSLAGVNEVDANNGKVDSLMDTLNKYIANAPELKKEINYTGSEANLRENYNNAIKAGETFLNDLPNQTNKLDASALETVNKAINDAIKALNGEENITRVRNEEEAKVDALENLNDAQKAAIKEKMDKATTPEAIRNETAVANSLDTKMGELKDAVNNASDVKNTSNYRNEDEAERTRFDNAYNDANNLVTKETGSAILDEEVIQGKINELNSAKDALKGEEKLAKAKENVVSEIDKLENLNKAQKDALKDKVNDPDTDLIANVNQVVADSKTLDDAMKDLKDTAKAIQDELDKENNLKYKAAGEPSKGNFDNARQAVEDLVGNNEHPDGINVDIAAVNKAKEDLIDAANKLDGNTNFKNAKDLAIEKVKGTDLSPEEKQALIDQIMKVKDPEDTTDEEDIKRFQDELNKIVDKADLIKDIKANDKLTDKQKEDLIEDVLNANVDDKANELENKNSYADTLENINKKKDFYEEINDNPTLTQKDKDKLTENVSDLDPRNKNFETLLDNEKAKKDLVEEIRNKDHLTEDQKDALAEEALNLDNKDDQIDEKIQKIKDKADLINEIQNKDNLTKEDKKKLSDEILNIEKDSSTLDDKLDKIKDKIDLIEEIRQNDQIDEETKEKLVDQVHETKNDSETIDDELANIKAKEDAIEKIKNDPELTDKQKENLINEILNLDNKQDPEEFKKQLENIDKKADLYKEINNSDLEEYQKDHLLEELDPVDSNDTSADTIFNNIRDKMKEFEKIDSNENLTYKDKEKLINQLIKTPSDDPKFKDKLEDIDSKLTLIDEIRKDDKLDEELKDKLINQVIEIENGTEETDKELENIKAKKDAIDQIVDKNITKEQKDKLIDELVNLDNKQPKENLQTEIDNANKKADLYEAINNSNLSDEEKAKLIELVDNTKITDPSASQQLDNIKNILDQLKRIHADETLSDDDKTRLANEAINNNPRETNYQDIAKNIDKKHEAISEIRQNDNLTDAQKDALAKEIAELDSSDPDFDSKLDNIKKKVDLIVKGQTSEDLTDEDKAKLIKEIIELNPNDDQFSTKLNNIEKKIDLVTEIRKDPKISDDIKDILVDKALQIENDSEIINDEVCNIIVKKDVIGEIQNDTLLNDKIKNHFIDEVLNLDNKQPQEQHQKQIDNIKDQITKMKEIESNIVLTDEDKKQLKEDVLSNDPTSSNYDDIANKIDKKEQAIMKVRENNNLTNDQKDSIAKNIRELDETSETFDKDLENELAKADLIAKLNQDSKEDKLTEQDKNKLVDEVIKLPNNDQTNDNLEEIKIKEELVKDIHQNENLPQKTKEDLRKEVIDNSVEEPNFKDKHDVLKNKFVDVQELTNTRNQLVDLTNSKKYPKYTKEQQEAIQKAIADSDKILNDITSYNLGDITGQTNINKELLEMQPLRGWNKNWLWLLVPLGLFPFFWWWFFILAKRRKKDEEDK
ncbi:GA module-containing protein [Mycoplasmopsis glycophila]|uniref:ECM-binding protein homolog n=1 Tax=Mycoplasmopsis glycophila TaxID=171285 RepID=A0A449AUB6_9BACT|nr:GA module-containing protein [Mycoplasmopsis glycophila]VEU70097.1 ECM-binding protein homolog [Mycoplasmopsis glycophila]